MTNLTNKIILVTGASDGIGREAALTYAAAGATVILHGRNVKKLEQVYDEIEKNGGPKPALAPLDLLKASPEQYQELADMLKKEFGQLDGLLHNAGILGTLTPIEQYPIEKWYSVMQINLNAVFLLTQTMLPLLKQSKAASLIFTSSGVGQKGRAYWGAYAVSKFGIEGLAQILKDELEHTNIKVNLINPGPTRTKMRAKAYPAEDPNTLKTPKDLMPKYLELMTAL